MFATALLISAGFLFRDGWPPTGYTNKGARPGGAILCGLGTYFIHYDWKLSLAWAAVFIISFFSDMQHGKGQNARGWTDMFWLAVSGITSVAPFVAFGYAKYANPLWLLLLLAVIVKPVLWKICWKVFYRKDATVDYFTSPTRMAAIFFGAMIGLAIGGLS